MTIQIFVPLILAFFVGCVFTEIRWIEKMRSLRGKLSLVEAMREYPCEHAPSGAATAVRVLGSPMPGSRTLENVRESMLNLQQTLTAETVSVRVAKTSEISKS